MLDVTAMKHECHIAAKFNDRKMLEAKWKPILNYNLIDT